MDGVSNAVRSRLSLPATDEYSAWLDGLADATSLPKTTLVAEGLRLFAESRGYAPPPRRQGRVGRRKAASA